MRFDSKEHQGLLRNRLLDHSKGAEIRSTAASRINDRTFLVEAMLREGDDAVFIAINYRVQHLRQMERNAEEEAKRAWKQSHPKLDGLLRAAASSMEWLLEFVDNAATPKRARPDW